MNDIHANNKIISDWSIESDSRGEIITFKTTKFDTIAIVYGDKDCFKELKGDKSLHTFTKEWVGYETEFSKSEVLITLILNTIF